MSVQVIGMFAAFTGGTENAQAQIDVPQDGFILGVDWDVNAALDADDEAVAIELSFIATNQLAQNDVRSRISSVSSLAAVLTSVGVNSVNIQKYVDLHEIVVSGGERIFMHGINGTGVVVLARCNIHFEMSGRQRTAARRR